MTRVQAAAFSELVRRYQTADPVRRHVLEPIVVAVLVTMVRALPPGARRHVVAAIEDPHA